VLIEAQDFLGGRIKKFNFNGYIVEEGACWIHGQFARSHDPPLSIQNPALTMKNRYKIKGNFTSYDDRNFLMEDGNMANRFIVEKCSVDLEKGMDYCSERRDHLWKEAGKSHTEIVESMDISIGECLMEYGYFKPGNSSPNESSIRQLLAWDETEFEYTINRSSLMNSIPINHVNLVEYNDDDFFVTDQRGYSVFLEEIARKFTNNILLKQKVTTIRYNSNDVQVQKKAV
jgi:hypothetical protein